MQQTNFFPSVVKMTLLCMLGILLLSARPAFGQGAENTPGVQGRSAVAKSTGPSEAKDGQFGQIVSPIAFKSLPFKSGDDSQDVLEVTNKSDKAISRLSVRILLLRKSGQIESSYAARNDRWFGLEQKNSLRPGKAFKIDVAGNRLREREIVAVAGLPKEVIWEDGTMWPKWIGPAPPQHGDQPISIQTTGVVTVGDFSAPMLQFFNHTDKSIKRLEYRIHYLDAQGKELDRGVRTRIGGIGPKEGLAYVAAPGVPENASRVSVDLNFADFGDGSKWTAKD